MFFIPLSHVESVELVIHALRAAGGQADCTACPAYRVCMKQCLSIADAVSRMIQAGSLPTLDPDDGPPAASPGAGNASEKTASKPQRGGLKIVK